MSSKIKLAVVDDMALWRTSIIQIVSGLDDVEVVCSVPNGDELISYVKTNPIDVVLLDVDIKIGMDGIKTLEAVKSEKLGLKIIMLSVHHEKKLVEYCLELGAKAYLPKDIDFELLYEVIKYVYKGKNCAGISRAICNELCDDIAKGLNEKYGLTDKEQQVLYLSCKGEPIKMIALELKTSERTIQRHIENIYRKTHIKSKTDMISFGIRNGVAW